MRTIYKYAVEPTHAGPTEITLPVGSIPLAVDVQDHVIFVWIEQARQSNADEVQKHTFHVLGTGWDMPDTDARMDYIGTVFQGPFVWHIYHTL